MGRDRIRHLKGLTLRNPTTPEPLLGLCVADKPCPIGRDDGVRRQSNGDLGRFLARVFRLPSE